MDLVELLERPPGLLPFGLTVEDLRRGVSKVRNRVIGRVFHALGLIEQWGSGVQRMTAACRDAGLPAPVFEEIGTRFRVTVSTERTGPPALDETDQVILDALAGGVGRLTSEIAKAIDLTPRATRTRLVIHHGEDGTEIDNVGWGHRLVAPPRPRGRAGRARSRAHGLRAGRAGSAADAQPAGGCRNKPHYASCVYT